MKPVAASLEMLFWRHNEEGRAQYHVLLLCEVIEMPESQA